MDVMYEGESNVRDCEISELERSMLLRVVGS